MTEALRLDFVRHALVAIMLAGVACGIIGSLVVVNRIVSLSGGIAHAAYGGVGLGYLCGFNPLLGALLFGLGSSICMGLAEIKSGERADTLIGIMWSVGMALGTVFVGLSKGYAVDLMSYLFGSILAISVEDITILLILDMITVVVVVIFYKGFLAISFDRDFAKALNIPVDFIYLVLLSLITLSIVSLMRLVGLILVIALLSMPAAISGHFTRDLRIMMVLSTVLGWIFSILGLFLSYYLNIASGASIVLVSAVGFALALACGRRVRQRKRT